MKVSYICPVWITDQETLDLTRMAIESFRVASPFAELILIDNASIIGGGLLRDRADVYIRNKENLGFPPAINQGLKLATGEIIAVTNNDILVSSNWLEVAEPIVTHPLFGVLHFRMVNYSEFGHIQYGTGIALEGKERWCTNSFFVLTPKTLEKVGLFDENFGKGIYDDYDYHWRVDQAGLKQVYTDKAYYAHKMTYSFNKVPSKEHQESIKKNLEYFKSKWGKEPEELFRERWPRQWEEDYQYGFKIR